MGVKFGAILKNCSFQHDCIREKQHYYNQSVIAEFVECKVADFGAKVLGFDPPLQPKYLQISFEIISAELPKQLEIQKFRQE